MPIAGHSPIFERGDIVRVPFPHVETSRSGMRPALVVNRQAIKGIGDLFWALMITSAENSRLARRYLAGGSLWRMWTACALRHPLRENLDAGKYRRNVDRQAADGRHGEGDVAVAGRPDLT